MRPTGTGINRRRVFGLECMSCMGRTVEWSSSKLFLLACLGSAIARQIEGIWDRRVSGSS